MADKTKISKVILFYIKCSFSNLIEQKGEMSPLLRETLAPFMANAAIKSKTLALFGPLHHATHANCPVKLSHTQGDVMSS